MTLPDDTIRVELTAVVPCSNSTPCQTFTSHSRYMLPMCPGCNGDGTRTVPTGIVVERCPVVYDKWGNAVVIVPSLWREVGP